MESNSGAESESKPQSIRFVTRKWAPAMGGMETYCHRLTEELSKSQSVDVIALPGRVGGAAPSAFALILFGLKTVFKLFFASNVNIAHFGDMAIWPLALVVRMRHPKTRLVISAHGTDVSYPLRGGLLGSFYGVYLKTGAKLLPNVKVIANSAATAGATKRYGFKYIEIVSLATDQQEVDLEEKPSRNILFAGRLVKRKGFAWFAKNVLPGLPSDIRLRVAGTVWHAEEGDALKNERIDFLGRLSQDELRTEYAQALCVVIPNIDVKNAEFEGFGLVAPEGAAAGGVVVAAFHSGLKEAIIDGVTGFHARPGDAEHWQELIEKISAWSKSERAVFIDESVAQTREYYSWERVAKETLSAY